MSSGYKSVLAAVAAVTLPSAYAHRFRRAEPAQLQRSHHAAERTEARGSRPTAPQSCHKIPDAPAASCIGLQRSGFCEPHTTLHPPSHLKKRAALPVPPWQPAAKRASITPQTSQTPQITTVETVRQACKDICAQDPRVVGAAAAATATSNHTGITSCQRDEVLRRWEMTKLIQLLPAEIVQRIVGLSPDQFPHRNSRQIAEYLLAKAHSVHHKTIASARCTLSRLLSFLSANDLDWDQHFGRLTELDLFAFLMTVHTHATANATPARPGFGAVWGAYASLTFLNTHLCFQLPLHQVRSAIPKRDVKRGAGAIINGAIPLPPEALQALAATSRLHPRLQSCAAGHTHSYSRPLARSGKQTRNTSRFTAAFASTTATFWCHITPTANREIKCRLFSSRHCRTSLAANNGTCSAKLRFGLQLISCGPHLAVTPWTPPLHCKIARLQANASLPHFNLFYNMHAICHLQSLSYTHSKALARRWSLPHKQLVALGISVSN